MLTIVLVLQKALGMEGVRKDYRDDPHNKIVFTKRRGFFVHVCVYPAALLEIILVLKVE